MGKETLERQIDSNLGKRIAIAASILAVGLAAYKSNELRRAIRALPDFYEKIADKSSHASLRIHSTQTPEQADALFLSLAQDRSGTRRIIDLPPNQVEFMVKAGTSIETAHAAPSAIPGLYVVGTREYTNRFHSFGVYLTSRNFDRALALNPAEQAPDEN